MAQQINIVGFESFINCVEQIDKNKLIYCYFSGSKDGNGICWCSDCVKSEPHVRSALEKYAVKGSVFIFTEVGGKDSWQDLKNPFRIDRITHLNTLPTIMRWYHHQRLEGSYFISNEDILEMLFTDDLD